MKRLNRNKNSQEILEKRLKTNTVLTSKDSVVVVVKTKQTILISKTSRGGLVYKGVNQIQVDWTLQGVVRIPLEEKLYQL